MPEQAEEVKTPNAVRCTICGSTADLLNCGLYQCRATSAHMADATVGLFTNMSWERSARVWRPIETAPKDGTDILLYAPAREYEGKPVPERVTEGSWQRQIECQSEYHSSTGVYLGQSELDGWEGWGSWDGGFTEEQPPTHWMPKPDPPGTEIQSPKGTNAERRAAALFSCWGELLDRLGPE